jgi:GNAT superfamily N-acetyltransferase
MKNAHAQNDITVTAINAEDKSGLKEFIDLPWSIYNSKEHPEWVPPLKMAVYEALDTKKNPFYKRATIQLFLAYKNGKAVGRIAAIDNTAHNEFHEEKTGFFGFFECTNDQDVANALFGAAEKWLKSRELTTMRGPANPSTNHECGLLVRGQSQHPTIMTTWNPKYYTELHEKAGLNGVKDLVAYAIKTDLDVALPPKVIEYAERIRRDSKITFRDFDMKNFQREVDIIYDIYHSAWEKNWGFVPMTREEFNHTAKDMKMVLDPRFAFIAEVDGKPAGFMLALPDFNHIFKRIKNGKLFPTGIFKLLLGKYFLKSVRIITLGVKPEFRGGGIFAAFTHESFVRARKHKIIYGEASWILEDNEAMNKPWRDLGAPLYRRWRMYERTIN